MCVCVCVCVCEWEREREGSDWKLNETMVLPVLAEELRDCACGFVRCAEVLGGGGGGGGGGDAS